MLLQLVLSDEQQDLGRSTRVDVDRILRYRVDRCEPAARHGRFNGHLDASQALGVRRSLTERGHGPSALPAEGIQFVPRQHFLRNFFLLHACL